MLCNAWQWSVKGAPKCPFRQESWPTSFALLVGRLRLRIGLSGADEVPKLVELACTWLFENVVTFGTVGWSTRELFAGFTPKSLTLLKPLLTLISTN